MRIYLASRYGRRHELQGYAEQLREAGHEVTAQWIWGAEENPDHTREDNAIMDIEDVLRADVVLSFTEPYGSFNKGGGRHWEMGLGYGAGKMLICIGPQEIIFHHHPSVKMCDSLSEAIAYLRSLSRLSELAMECEGRG